MVECGLWLSQAIPRVKIVFGRKSLDDVIPGSWYIIPLPSIREVVIGFNPSGSFHLCEEFGAVCCLIDVLGVFKLTLLLQWIGLVTAGMSWMRVWGCMEDPQVSEDWMRTPRGFHPPDPFCKSGGLWALKICVLVSSFSLEFYASEWSLLVVNLESSILGDTNTTLWFLAPLIRFDNLLVIR